MQESGDSYRFWKLFPRESKRPEHEAHHFTSAKPRTLAVCFHCLLPAFMLPVRRRSNAFFCQEGWKIPVSQNTLVNSRPERPGMILCGGLSLTRLHLYFKSLKMRFLLRLRRMRHSGPIHEDSNYNIIIPVAPTWNIGHPWNASFRFSFLI
jgi:hypothetical protein